MTDNVLNYSIVDLRHDLSFHFVLFIIYIRMCFFLFGNALFTTLKNITVQCTRYSTISSLITRRETDVDCLMRRVFFSTYFALLNICFHRFLHSVL